ncbi:MAG: glycosyltransferase [Bacteroidia bacterium]|nr:glycosyltransferase [Bacteroidia bacterium]
MISKITFHAAKEKNLVDGHEEVFSILIPSWNNLAYLKCCIESIRKNSKHNHQIIVHVNEGIDGTLEWVKDQNISYSYSKENVGVCYGFNAPACLVNTNYIVLSDDDYYFAPDWDRYLFDEIKSLDHEYFCITGSMIEHSPTKFKGIIAPYDYGKTINDFQEELFLKEFHTLPFQDWTGCNWYPMVLHKNIWKQIGGLSTEYTPGMASDPDMMMKLWHCGVRYYKGISKSRVYHFTSKSTSRVKRNDGNKQFLLKWGISKSTFLNYFLRLGQPFSGPTPEPDIRNIKLKLLKDKLKRFFSVWKK